MMRVLQIAYLFRILFGVTPGDFAASVV